MGDFPFLASRFSYVSIQSLEDEGIKIGLKNCMLFR